MEAFFFCPSLDGWCSGSVVVECSSSVGQTMRRKISLLLGSSIAASFVRLRLRFWFPFSRSRFSLPLWQCKGFGVLPGCQRLRRRLVPCGEALWPQPLPSSQAPAGNTFLGLVARFSAPGVSLSCPYLKKSISRAQRVQENPYLCARLRSHKRSYLLLGSRTPFYFGFLFCQKQGASAFGIRPLCSYKDLIIFFFVSSLTFRYRDIALLPSAWPLIEAMSESLKPAS